MSVIYCYYIIDAVSLCELVSVSDSRGFHVEYLEISIMLSKKQFMAQSQYFIYPGLSGNDSDLLEWLINRSNHVKYMKLLEST